MSTDKPWQAALGAEAPSLYRISEFPELFADACLRGSDGTLKFISFYGRDGSVMQFIAALELGPRDGGVTRFHLSDEDGGEHLVETGSSAHLSKFSARLPPRNLFGPLSQTWLYDSAFEQPDRANRIGWVIYRSAPSEQQQAHKALADKAWALTGQLSPVALLDAWREPIQAWCEHTRAWDSLDDRLYPPLGGIAALRVSITDAFLRFISQGVREHSLPV
ncbi:MAG: hypothetical protein LBH10_05710 [Burkholderiaceae bacterium]|jgi:hypothetical protein|nr:hypothetical protein [Burkholderiaceae bacterium]